MTWGLNLDPGTIIVPAEHPARLLKDHLKIWMAERYPDLTLGLALPSEYTAAEHGPVMVVFDDGGPEEWPVSDKLTLRVVVWTDSLPLSREMASYALGQTLSRKAEGIAQILPGTRVLDARDSNNGAIMASYTVRARVRTSIVLVNNNGLGGQSGG